MYRHSDVHPYSQSLTPIGVVFGCWYPIQEINSIQSHAYLIVVTYFEGKMLQKVCGSICLVCLGTTPSIDPDTNSRSLSPWRVLGGDLNTVLSQLRETRVTNGYSYRQTVRERRALCLNATALRDGSREASLQWGCTEGCSIAQTLAEVQS
jgi:hypothetical protein